MLTFREVESRDTAIAPSVEGERACNGNGDPSGDEQSGDGDGTTSGSSVDSNRVNAALLAEKSQHMSQTRRIRDRDSPVSSEPPIQHTDHPNRLIRWCRRHGKLKVEAINVSQAEKVEKTHLKRMHLAQPCGNPSTCAYGVIGPRHRRDRIKIGSVKVRIGRLNDKIAQEGETTHLGPMHITQPLIRHPNHPYGLVTRCRQHGHIKIKPRNISQTRNGANAYLGRINAMQSMWKPKKHVRRLYKLTMESRMPGEPWRNDRRLKIKSINISQMEEVEMTYHRCTQVAQPRGNTPERCHRVHRPKRQRGHIKSAPINVSRMETSQNAYLQHVNALPPNR